MYFSSGLAHTQKRIYALFFKIRNTRAGSNFARSCNARPTPPRHFRHFLVSRNESQRAILCAFATSLIVSNVTERKSRFTFRCIDYFIYTGLLFDISTAKKSWTEFQGLSTTNKHGVAMFECCVVRNCQNKKKTVPLYWNISVWVGGRAAGPFIAGVDMYS